MWGSHQTNHFEEEMFNKLAETIEMNTRMISNLTELFQKQSDRFESLVQMKEAQPYETELNVVVEQPKALNNSGSHQGKGYDNLAFVSEENVPTKKNYNHKDFIDVIIKGNEGGTVEAKILKSSLHGNVEKLTNPEPRTEKCSDYCLTAFFCFCE